MASAADVRVVRNNINEQDTDTFSDGEIETLVDEVGVDAASAALWRRKAAAFSELVNQTEAGASVQFSDLFKNAKAMAEYYDGLVADVVAPPSNAARVHKIVRT